ncbi:MAG: DMT family transporter [Phycisphaerae bacterium]
MNSPHIPRSRRQPLFLLLLNIACVATAELFLAMGSKGAQAGGILDFAALSSPCTVVGILFHISAFVCWMLALRTVPLGLAYNFTAVNQVLVPVGALVVLHERISGVKWAGIALVVAGFVLLVPLIVRTEEQLEPADEKAAAQEPAGAEAAAQ